MPFASRRTLRYLILQCVKAPSLKPGGGILSGTPGPSRTPYRCAVAAVVSAAANPRAVTTRRRAERLAGKDSRRPADWNKCCVITINGQSTGPPSRGISLILSHPTRAATNRDELRYRDRTEAAAGKAGGYVRTIL